MTLTNRQEHFLFKLYENTFKDENAHMQFESRTLTLFTGLILAITGGVLFIIKDVSEPEIKILALFVGGGLEICLSYLGIKAFESNYRRQLESIALRAKLENLLDFNNDNYKTKAFKRDEEGLIHLRYAEDRKIYNNSKEFVDDRLKKGLGRIVKIVFSFILSIGIVFIILGICKLLVFVKVVKCIWDVILFCL